MKSHRCLLIVLLLAASAIAAKSKDPQSLPDPEIRITEKTDTRQRTVEVMGDWIIRSDKTSADTIFKVHGNIYLLPNVVWEMTDCDLTIMCEHARQYRMYWAKGSVFKTQDCRLGGFDDGSRFAPANFEVGGGTWIATDTEVHTCYAVSVSKGTVFRGERFTAGKNPDSIIVSGDAQVYLKDSRFPISISMHCSKGGSVELDLPCNKPMTQVMDATQFLNGGGQYTITFVNTIVPHWFIFARDISSGPDVPKADITIKQCQNFLLSILTRDVTGDVRLPVNLEHPIEVGNATIRRAEGATDEDVKMRMYGGVYFNGNPDATVYGPEQLVDGKPAHLAETMIWGGKLKIDGGPNKTILLNCTTMDVWNGELTLENLQLGRPNAPGQIIVEKTGKLISRNCDFGKDLFILTKDEATAEMNDYTPGQTIKVETQGGPVIFKNPKMNNPEGR